MRLGGMLSFTTLVMVLSNGIIGTMLSCCAWTEVSASIEKSMDMKNDFFIEKNVFGVCVCCEDKPASKAPDTRGLCTASVYHFLFFLTRN